MKNISILVVFFGLISASAQAETKMFVCKCGDVSPGKEGTKKAKLIRALKREGCKERIICEEFREGEDD